MIFKFILEKWVLGRESDHSPPSSAEVKNGRVILYSPIYTSVAWCLINEAQGQLYLYLHGLPPH
jgi:hypothetical protein